MASGESGEFLRGEAAVEDGHEEGGDLALGDGWIRGVEVDYGVDEGVDLGVGEDDAAALVADDV